MRELCVAQALPEALRTEGPSTPQFEEEEQLPLACEHASMGTPIGRVLAWTQDPADS